MRTGEVVLSALRLDLVAWFCGKGYEILVHRNRPELFYYRLD
jgi:hypothetical protein